MQEEYSYFRAEGHSLKVVEHVEKVRELPDRIGNVLCMHYNAQSIKLTDGVIAALAFRVGDHMPDGWAPYAPPGREFIASLRDAQDNVFRAAPPKNSKDWKILQEATEEYGAAAYSATLGVGDFFPGATRKGVGKERPLGHEGEYIELNDAFVKASVLSQERSGVVPDSCTQPYLEKGEPHVIKDVMTYRKMDGHYYIRVPNDTSGRPLFMPPDAVRVPLAAMLQVDQKAHAQLEAEIVQNAVQPAPSKRTPKN